MNPDTLTWEQQNEERINELNDLLDACATLEERRVLYQTFTKEEKDGIISEYARRANNRRVPIGSLVYGHVHPTMKVRQFSFFARSSRGMFSATHMGMATVMGSPKYGSPERYIMLHPPWQDKEGRVVMFGTVYIDNVEVVGDESQR